MDTLMRRPAYVVAVIVLALVLILAGQAFADARVATASDGSTGAAIERAGFAYLTGVRTFTAAVLWNRIDPIYHEYYRDKPLAEQTQIMPTIKFVTLLDPQFVEAYNVGAWVLARRGLVDEGIELAREGVEANPDSGLLHVNYAQIVWLNGGDIDVAVEHAETAFAGDVVWRDEFERHDQYAIIRAIFAGAGRDDRADEVMAAIEHIDEELGDQLPPGSHDHDGDGVPDH